MPKTAVLTADAKAAKRKAFRKHLKRYWVLYAMLVLPVAYYIVFKYVPMVGNVLAFRRYRPGKGPFGTEWTLRYFDRLLRDPMFWRALRNTLVLSIGNILIDFPIHHSFCHSAQRGAGKKIQKSSFRTRCLLCRALSPRWWCTAILNEILSAQLRDSEPVPGPGGHPRRRPHLLHERAAMVPPGVYFIRDLAVPRGGRPSIYLAAITSISPDLFEAAEMDGASRLQQIWYVSDPVHPAYRHDHADHERGAYAQPWL